MRLIDANEVKRQIDEWLDIVGYCTIGKGLSYYGELLGCIEDAPTIEAAPVVHGEWIYEYHTWHCNICGCHPYKGYIPKEPSNFCPNCGAKMNRGYCSD